MRAVINPIRPPSRPPLRFLLGVLLLLSADLAQAEVTNHVLTRQLQRVTRSWRSGWELSSGELRPFGVPLYTSQLQGALRGDRVGIEGAITRLGADNLGVDMRYELDLSWNTHGYTTHHEVALRRIIIGNVVSQQASFAWLNRIDISDRISFVNAVSGVRISGEGNPGIDLMLGAIVRAGTRATTRAAVLLDRRFGTSYRFDVHVVATRRLGIRGGYHGIGDTVFGGMTVTVGSIAVELDVHMHPYLGESQSIRLRWYG